VKETRWPFVYERKGYWLVGAGQAKLAELRPYAKEKFLTVKIVIGVSSDKYCRRL
jgi:hypothetical protein